MAELRPTHQMLGDIMSRFLRDDQVDDLVRDLIEHVKTMTKDGGHSTGENDGDEDFVFGDDDIEDAREASVTLISSANYGSDDKTASGLPMDTIQTLLDVVMMSLPDLRKGIMGAQIELDAAIKRGQFLQNGQVQIGGNAYRPLVTKAGDGLTLTILTAPVNADGTIDLPDGWGDLDPATDGVSEVLIDRLCRIFNLDLADPIKRACPHTKKDDGRCREMTCGNYAGKFMFSD